MNNQIERIDLKTEFLIGIEAVDRQHSFLIDLYNDLADKLNQGKDQPEIEEVLEKLFDYTRYHFSTEEKIMEARRYPGLESHRRQHQTFIRTLSDFSSHHNLTGEGLAGVVNFLGQWVQGHILITDKEMGEFLMPPARDTAA